MNASPTDFTPVIMDGMGDEPARREPDFTVDVGDGDEQTWAMLRRDWDALTPVEPLAYSETVELPDQRHSHMPAALFAAAVLALTASWFLVRQAPTQVSAPSRPPSDNSAKPFQPEVTLPALTIVDAPPINTESPPVRVPLNADTIYIASITASGIGISSRDAAIGLAHHICFRFSQGVRYDTLLADGIAESKSLTPQNVASLITASVHVYCPQYSPQIGG